MEFKEFPQLKEKLYYEQLENGLEVFKGVTNLEETPNLKELVIPSTIREMDLGKNSYQESLVLLITGLSIFNHFTPCFTKNKLLKSFILNLPSGLRQLAFNE